MVVVPMCMQSANENNHISDFHHIHFGAKALEGAGLIVLEIPAIKVNDLIGPSGIGILNDDKVPEPAKLVKIFQHFGAKAGAQLGHADR
jgi:NADPH2 dehydrogenase